MIEKYCYWSVATGAYGVLMEQCVRSARAAGVFQEFHVLTDRPIEGCECYDALECDKADGLFKLHYLKVGMSRLSRIHAVGKSRRVCWGRWRKGARHLCRIRADHGLVFVRGRAGAARSGVNAALRARFGRLPTALLRLSFDYFVWLDADTVFVRRPMDILGPLGKSPLHVPLEANLSALGADATWKGASVFALRDLLRDLCVMNQVYLAGSAFWIVHRAAIDLVYDLALKFWHEAKEAGLLVGVSIALSYAMQILCADPERHLLRNATALWAGNDSGNYDERVSSGSSWRWRHALATEPLEVNPAIVHLGGRSKAGSPVPA